MTYLSKDLILVQSLFASGLYSAGIYGISQAIDPAFEPRNNGRAWQSAVLRGAIHATSIARSTMNDFNRKVEDASARVSHTINEAAERLEKEIPEFIKYLNDEVVPAVRTHSTKALRVASVKLAEFANYLEQQHPPK
jgi:hypothetical protein